MKNTFATLYPLAQAQRAKFSADPALSAWFHDKSGRAIHAMKPPVIGFGLPKRTEPERPLIVTIGINPSSKEFTARPQPLPGHDDAEVQWSAQTEYFVRSPYGRWFEPAAAFVREFARAKSVLRGASHILSPYWDGDSVHADLSPLVTRGFDAAYGAAASREKDIAAQMLREGIVDVLCPLLTLLNANRQVTNVIVFGYVPSHRCSDQGGNATMKDMLFGQFVVSGAKWAPPIGRRLFAWGGVVPGGLFDRILAPGIPWGFVSKGPSSRDWQNDPQAPSAAGRALAALGP